MTSAAYRYLAADVCGVIQDLWFHYIFLGAGGAFRPGF